MPILQIHNCTSLDGGWWEIHVGGGGKEESTARWPKFRLKCSKRAAGKKLAIRLCGRILPKVAEKVWRKFSKEVPYLTVKAHFQRQRRLKFHFELTLRVALTFYEIGRTFSKILTELFCCIGRKTNFGTWQHWRRRGSGGCRIVVFFPGGESCMRFEPWL